MPISPEEWQSIYGAIDRMARPSEFVQGKVVKRDAVKMLVWIDEIGDQPIPIFSFDYEIKYYYERPSASVNVTAGSPGPRELFTRKSNLAKKEVRTLCPEIGETVLVVRHYGSRRLPKCIGVLRSKDFATPGEE